jgi:hypothetical protein
MLFTPFSTNPFPYLQETYNTLNRLPNPAQFASTQTPTPILDPQVDFTHMPPVKRIKYLLVLEVLHHLHRMGESLPYDQ